MTAGQKIKSLLKEREERKERPFNITQLANAMGKARESVSRRVGGKTGMTEDYAELFAKALGISAEELLPPAVEVVSLESIDRRLQGLATLVAELNKLSREALAELAKKPRTSASRPPQQQAAGTKR